MFILAIIFQQNIRYFLRLLLIYSSASYKICLFGCIFDLLFPRGYILSKIPKRLCALWIRFYWKVKKKHNVYEECIKPINSILHMSRYYFSQTGTEYILKLSFFSWSIFTIAINRFSFTKPYPQTALFQHCFVKSCTVFLLFLSNASISFLV